MTLKVRKQIKIDDFMRLWDNVLNKRWEDVIPGWEDEVINILGKEIAEKFTLGKGGGSYGKVSDDLFKIAAKNIEYPLALPRAIGYRESYRKKYPITYVRSGELRDKIPSLLVNLPKTVDSLGIEVGIPMKTVTYDEEPWKDVPPDPMGYGYLEQSRSYIRTSLLLSLPGIMKKTFKLIGT